jgi:hypothetical protein
MNSLLAEMQLLVDKINEGTATMGEIEAFAAAAQDLNERAIIYRYKAYELKIHPTQFDVEETVQEQPSPAEPHFVATKLDDSALDMDFDLFSSGDDSLNDEPTLEESHDFSKSIPEISHDEQTTSFDLYENEMEEQETVAYLDEAENNETPLMEEFDAVQEPVYTLDEEPHATNETTLETEVLPEASEPLSQETSLALHPIYERLSATDDSLAARMLTVRLETLKGAFGFNERMQIVNELLGSSNDLYHEVIEQLDNMDGKDEARLFVSSIANKYNWNVSSTIALEFIQKVERRYA